MPAAGSAVSGGKRPMEDIRIAAVTCTCPAGAVDDNLETTARWVQEAAARGAAIVCFPELNLSGYCLDKTVYRATARRYADIVQALSRMATAFDVVILAGTVAGDGGGDRFFAQHLVVVPHGPAGAYAKLHIAPPEKKVFMPGGAISLFETNGARFGIQLCYDAHFPELSTQMAVQGADIFFMPHASPRNTPEAKLTSWMRHLPARAYDNTVFVVACNQSGSNGVGLEFPGVAVALNPSGEPMAKTTAPDSMIVVDLPQALLEASRNHPMRYFLAGRRPDLYGFGSDQ